VTVHFRGRIRAAKERPIKCTFTVTWAVTWARATDIVPIIAEIRADGASSLRAPAAGLSERGITAARWFVVGRPSSGHDPSRKHQRAMPLNLRFLSTDR
jgi:hypothetical protein